MITPMIRTCLFNMDNLEFKKVKTRKPHRCFACLQKFDKGAEMTRQVNADGGEIWQLYSCPTCDELMVISKVIYKEDEFEEGFVSDWMQEYNVKNPDELLKKLNEEKP